MCVEKINWIKGFDFLYYVVNCTFFGVCQLNLIYLILFKKL